jgi:hypothetical protein
VKRFLLTALLLAACGGGHGGTGGGGDGGTKSGGLSVTDYLTSTRNSTCEFVVNCCTPATGMTYYASVADCEAAATASTDADIASVNAGLAAHGVTYDATAAAACNAAQAAWAAACAPTITQAEATTLSCYNVFAGAVPTGGACNTTTLFCQSGLYCQTSTSTCQPTIAAGAVCGSCDNLGNCTLATCATGNYCQTGGDPDDSCLPQIPDGDNCTASAQCTSGYCDPTMEQCAEHTDYTLLQTCTTSTGSKM